MIIWRIWDTQTWMQWTEGRQENKLCYRGLPSMPVVPHCVDGWLMVDGLFFWGGGEL